MSVALCWTGNAQTAHFAGAVTTLGSGFNSPGGVAVDASGNVYVTNFNNNAVQEILAVNGSIPASPTIVTLSSSFTAPTNVTVDAKGDVFVTQGNNLVLGPVYEIVAVNGSIPASNPTINALGSGFSAPEGIAVDGSGNVFVADTYNNAVKEIVAVNGVIPASPTIRTLGSGFNQPSGVVLDGSGDVFVADSQNNLVKEMLAVNGSIPASPTIVTLGGTFNQPSDVALDGSGDLFVVDFGDNTVKEIVAVNGVIPASPTIETLGGGFNEPPALAVDGSGNIYVADFGNNAVKEIMPAAGSFGAVNVGAASAGPIQLAFEFDTAGALGSTAVVTQGVVGLDFSDAGTGSCAAGSSYTVGQFCLMDVNFSPIAVGTRLGAAELLDGAGKVIATGLATGMGVAPQAGFRYVYGNTAPPAVINNSNIATGVYITIDSAGNLFVANNEAPESAHIANGSIIEFPPSGSGFGPPVPLGIDLAFPQGVAEDGAGNIYALFDADADYDPGTGSIMEYARTGAGYATPVTLASGLSYPNGLVIDGTGNLFFASYSSGFMQGSGNTPNSGAVLELPWTGTSYGSAVTLASGLSFPGSLAIDASENIFVAIPSDASGDKDSGSVVELKKTSAGYSSPATIAGALNFATAVRVDSSGNLLVITYSDQSSDPNSAMLLEYPATQSGFGEPVTLVAGVDSLTDVAVDSSGNILLLAYTNDVYEIPRHTAPTLTFATTPVGNTSSDSPQTVTLENTGNAALSFPIPATGDNPSVAAGFTLSSSAAGDCPLVAAGASTEGMLAAGADCLLPISFTPTEIGSISASLVLTDNALNAAAPNYATQSIGLAATATQGMQTIQFTALPSTATYGAPAIALKAVATSGLAVQFTVAGPATVTGSTLKITGAGSVVVTASQAGNSNYQAAPSMQQTITVDPGVLTVTAKNAAREYGKPNPAFTATITGFVNGDSAASAVKGTPRLATSATVKSPVGKVAIDAAAGTLAATNYKFKFENGTLTITKAPLTVTANNAKAVYDQPLPKFGYTAKGFLNGDAKSVLKGAPVEKTKAVRGSAPGSYAIDITEGTLTAENYSFVFEDGTLTIEPIGLAATPVISPGTGTYKTTQTVHITDVTPASTIYYTTNGSTPTIKSPKYTSAGIKVTKTMTIKGIAVAVGYTESRVASATLTFP